MAAVLPRRRGVQANDTVDRAEQLSDLREQYRTRLQGGGRSHLAVDLLFANPILTVKYVQDHLGVSQPGATNILRRLAAVGIVDELGWAQESGTGGSAGKYSRSWTRIPELRQSACLARRRVSEVSQPG